MNNTIVSKLNKTSFYSQDKSLSKSTNTHDTSYQPLNNINVNKKQMKSTISSNTLWKMPITFITKSLNTRYGVNIGLKRTSSSMHQDMIQLIKDYSIGSKAKDQDKPIDNQNYFTAKMKRKAQALLLKKKQEMIDLSHSMNHTFHKAIHDPINKLNEEKRSTVNLSKNVMMDYQDSNCANKMRNSKMKYQKMLDLCYEQKKLNLKRSLLKREMIFNEAKESIFEISKPLRKSKGQSPFKLPKQSDSSNAIANYYQSKQVYQDFKNRKIEEGARQYADCICNIDSKPYKKINERAAKKTFDKYHKGNLARAMKIVNIENSQVDVEDMEYYLRNNEILKKLLQQNQLKIQNEEQRHFQSNIIKRNFKQTTLNKMKMFNGNYFGVPV